MNNNNEIIKMSQDERGNVTRFERANGEIEIFKYFENGQLKEFKFENNIETGITRYDKNGNIIFKLKQSKSQMNSKLIDLNYNELNTHFKK